MIAEVKEQCLCDLEIRDDIWMCRHHIYRKGNRKYVSVSKVKRTLLPEDYSKVPLWRLEQARVRGILVDRWFSEYLSTGTVTMTFEGFEDRKTADDAERRFYMLVEWWEKHGLEATSIQQIVHSDNDRTAGTLDVGTIETIFDVKCVSKIQPNYALQIGGYLHMDPQKFPLRDGAIIHVMKDKVERVDYDARKVKRQWIDAVNWFHTMRELTGSRPRKKSD